MRCPTCGRYVAMRKYADHLDSHGVDEVDRPEAIEATSELVEPGPVDIEEIERLRGALHGMQRTPAPRRRRWPLVLLTMAVLAAFVGVYFGLRPGGGGGRVASSRVTTSTASTASTPSTGVSSTIGAGAPETQVPVVATTAPAPTIPPGPDARPQIKFLNGSFQCPGDGSLTVQGTVFNDGPGVYSVRFTVFILDSSGAAIDSAAGAVDHLAAGERRVYTATGTCTRPIAGGARARGQVDSITPG